MRHTPRLPGESRQHPRFEVIVGAPMTANSVARLALGIADNQAMSVLCESVAVRKVGEGVRLGDRTRSPAGRPRKDT